MLKRAVTGFALALNAMFARGMADAKQYRYATQPKRDRVRGTPRDAGAKLTKRAGRGVGDGRLTCRHGVPYNDRETMMRLRALENGAEVRVLYGSRGQVLSRNIKWTTAKAL